MKTRLDHILILVEAEAEERVKNREDGDLVAVLHGVLMEVGARVGEKMRVLRESQKQSKRAKVEG